MKRFAVGHARLLAEHTLLLESRKNLLGQRCGLLAQVVVGVMPRDHIVKRIGKTFMLSLG